MFPGLKEIISFVVLKQLNMKINFKIVLSVFAAMLTLASCNARQNNEGAELLAQLDSINCSCLVRNNGVTTQYSQQGVRDLYELVTERPEVLKGAHVADKIIGKGAAVLMVNGKIKRATTHVITTPALKMLRDAGIKVSYETEIPFVENRKKTGQCPLDERLKDIDDAESAMPIVDQFIIDLNNGNVFI